MTAFFGHTDVIRYAGPGFLVLVVSDVVARITAAPKPRSDRQEVLENLANRYV